MKIETLVNAEASLQELSTLKLPDAQLAWDLSEALEVAGKHLKKFHDKRNELVMEYGDNDPQDPNTFKILDVDKFNAEVKKLLDVEVVVEFPQVDLGQLNGATFAAKDMISWRTLGILKTKDNDSTKEEKPSKA